MKSKKRKESMNPSAVVPKENERNKQRINPSKEDVILENVSSNTTSEDCCHTKNCSHYIGKNRLSLYKGKFLFSIIAFTVAVIILFILFHVSYVNSQERIVSIHQNFCKDIAGRLESLTVENDSTVVLDKVISDLIAENQKNTLSLLELQYNKLQSDFAILSLWAGVLMIVFLIFSIYSIFKVDEMQKQGRDYLLKIEEISSSANEVSEKLTQQSQEKIENLDKMAQEEMEKLSAEYAKQLSELKEEIFKIQNSFQGIVKEKASDFEKTISTYREELKQNAIKNEQMLVQIVEAIKNSGASSSNKEQKG